MLSALGTVLGLTLGTSRFRRRTVAVLALGYSLFLPPLLAAWRFYEETPWLERMISLGGRLGYALTLFFRAQKVTDTLLFVVFAGLGCWIFGLLAGYALNRRSDLVTALAPAGVTLLIIQLYDSPVGDRGVIMAIFAFLCLLLLGRQATVRKRLSWRQERVSYSSDSWMDLNITVLISTLVLVILAWLLPTPGRPVLAAKVAWENITRPWEKIRENLGNAVAGVKGYQPATVVEFYGKTLPLGQKASSGEGVYLRVSVPLLGSADRYYWRVRTYDQYLDDQWQTTYLYEEPFTPDQNPLRLANSLGLANEFTFTSPQANLALLVTPVHPVWISRPSILSFVPTMENEIDPLMFRADPPILVGEQYVVHANMFNPTVRQLLAAGEIYPAWVSEHYLQLPADLSPRISELSERITADAETPYDKAAAITNYLRENITYTTSVEPPPGGIQALEWFLFDLRAGFCNYSASAEVILLRAAGVPARLVAGFAQGKYEPPDKYTILEKDAHAWPEVYFPGIGWVEFEPTGNQLALIRQPGDEQLPEESFPPVLQDPENANPASPSELEDAAGEVSPEARAPFSLWQMLLLFGILIACLAGFLFAYSTGRLDVLLLRLRQVFNKPLPAMVIGLYANSALPPPAWLTNWNHIASLTPIERTFRVVYRSLRWLGVKPLPAQTPAEAVAELSTHLPGVTNELQALLREYQHVLFSEKHFDLDVARKAEKAIRRQALRRAFQQRLRALRPAFLDAHPRRPK